MLGNRVANAMAVVLLSAPAGAQWGETARYVEVPEVQAEAASPECSAGVVYDSGIFTSTYLIAPDSTMVMKFDLPPGTNSLDQVCVRLAQNSNASAAMSFDIVIYNDNGPGGQPGTLLGQARATASSSLGGAGTQRVFSVDVSDAQIVLPDTSVYVGARWPSDPALFMMCGDGPFTTTQRPTYGSANRGVSWAPMANIFPTNVPKVIGVRVDPAVAVAPPPVPSVAPLVSSQYPDFRFWVRISDNRIGTAVAGCLPETVCVAGAIPTRAEVFLRIVGPKPNGYLWPNIVKFNTTKTEVWIRQVSTGITKYYLLPALPTDSSTLPGLVDKTGFLP